MWTSVDSGNVQIRRVRQELFQGGARQQILNKTRVPCTLHETAIKDIARQTNERG